MLNALLPGAVQAMRNSQFRRVAAAIRPCAIAATLLALYLLALSACVHATGPGKPITTTKKSPDMSQDAYRVSQPDEHPELTPEAVGRRVLKLLGALNSFEDQTAQRLSGQIGVPLKYAPLGKVHAFAVQLPASGWYYSLTYQGTEHAKKPLLTYEFQNPNGGGADMAPVCMLDYSQYAQALESSGFSSGADRDEIGRPLERLFRRGDLMVRIMTRVEFVEKEGTTPRTCVERLTAYDVE